MRRTMSTAHRLGALIGGNLTGRQDRQGPIAQFHVDRIELANLVESDDVLEMAAHHGID